MYVTIRRGATDPVCGMKVDRSKALVERHDGQSLLLLLRALPGGFCVALSWRSMDDAELFDRMHASLFASGRLIAAGSRNSSLIEREGLAAGVVPSAPGRSVFNSVIYRSPRNLTDALDELADIYEREEVRAWTVWVPERDREVAALLEARGPQLRRRSSGDGARTRATSTAGSPRRSSSTLTPTSSTLRA